MEVTFIPSDFDNLNEVAYDKNAADGCRWGNQAGNGFDCPLVRALNRQDPNDPVDDAGVHIVNRRSGSYDITGYGPKVEEARLALLAGADSFTVTI